MNISAVNNNKAKITFGEACSDGDVPVSDYQRKRSARISSLEEADASPDIFWRELKKLDLEQCATCKKPATKSVVSWLSNVFKR